MFTGGTLDHGYHFSMTVTISQEDDLYIPHVEIHKRSFMHWSRWRKSRRYERHPGKWKDRTTDVGKELNHFIKLSKAYEREGPHAGG